MMILVLVIQSDSRVGLSDEEIAPSTRTDSLPTAGNSDVSRLQELQLELQQRDEAISMKSDEIRRLALQNHDYETQVVFEDDISLKGE